MRINWNIASREVPHEDDTCDHCPEPSTRFAFDAVLCDDDFCQGRAMLNLEDIAADHAYDDARDR